MLQQTQVATVIPFFNRFLKRFPDVRTLARARVDTVLHFWTGLGYYARARNLHRAAQIIQNEHAGIFPVCFDDVLALPGIGKSTAGAILSLAFHRSYPILDGNVRRVLTRFYAISGDVSSVKGQEELWSLIQHLVPSKGGSAAAFNQAMMDIGATVCMRRKPKCLACPIRSHCTARALGSADSFPAPRKSRVRPHRMITMVILFDPKGRVLLERRPSEGIWGGLWSFPECVLDADIEKWCESALGVNATLRRALPRIEHGLTHFVLEIDPVLLTVSARDSDKLATEGREWIRAEAVGKKGLPIPVKNILNQIVRIKNDSDR
jgi:A/G-specific adenine glycosylase